MPVIFGFFFRSFPTGLTLYFVINNFISIGQQKALQRDKGGKHSAIGITLVISAIVFVVGYLIALIG